MMEHSIRRRLSALVLGLLLATGPATAAEFDDPEWPCIQRKVSHLSIGQMWPGPMPEGNWRNNPEIRALANALAQRRVGLEEVEARAGEFAGSIDDAVRGEYMAELFAGILEIVDAERGQIISGIGRYARSQTALSERIETTQQELARLNGEAEKNWDRIEELEDTVAWDARIFRDRQQSLTYVCETPVLLEQRVFAIARLLAAKI